MEIVNISRYFNENVIKGLKIVNDNTLYCIWKGAILWKCGQSTGAVPTDDSAADENADKAWYEMWMIQYTGDQT